MTTTTLSVRIPEDLAHKLNLLSKATRRTKSFCAVEAIQEYLEKEAWQIQAIEDGLDDLENSRMLNHSKVKEWVESWDTLSEKRPPKCK